MSGLATSVIPLLSQWEKYTSEHPEGDVPGFARWVLPQQPAQEPKPPAPPLQPLTSQTPQPTATPPPPSSTLPTTAHSGLLIDRLHRLLSLRSKSIIKSLGFTKPQEFAV